MFVMSITLVVLKLERSSEVRLGQLLNMEFMFVTFSVLRYSSPSMVAKSLHAKNQAKQFVGRALAKEGSKTTFVMLFLLYSVVPSPSYQAGKVLSSFSENAPAGLFASCLKVSVPAALSNTTYDSLV